MAQSQGADAASKARTCFNVGHFHLSVSIANEIARMVVKMVTGDMEAVSVDWKYYFLADHYLHRRWVETDGFGQRQLVRQTLFGRLFW